MNPRYAAVATALFVVTSVFATPPESVRPVRVAVNEARMHSPSPDLAWIGPGVTAIMAKGLREVPGLAVLETISRGGGSEDARIDCEVELTEGRAGGPPEVLLRATVNRPGKPPAFR